MKIRARFAANIFIAGGLGVAALIADRVLATRAMITNRLESRGSALAESLSTSAAPLLARGDAAGLASEAGMVARLPEIGYVVIEDGAERSLFEKYNVSRGERLQESPIYEAESEIRWGGRSLGTVHVGVIGRAVARDLRTMARRGLALALGSLLVLAMASWALGSAMGRALERVLDGLRRIGDPELEPLPDEGKDSEIGRLSGTLRALHDRLQEESLRRRELENAREDMTNMLVHDFKQPLTMLKLGLGMLSAGDPETPAGRRARAALRMSDKAVQQLDAMVSSLLQVAKLDHSQAPLEKRRLEVGELLRDLAEPTEALVRESGHEWAMEIEEEAGRRLVYADREMLRRVIGNLVMNAVEHTPPNGRITLGARLLEEDRSKVALFVSDQGRGVAPHFMAEIFKKYRSFAHSGRNVGLGLAFCKLAADRHGASVRLLDSTDGGATFAFVLPVIGAQHEARAKKAQEGRNDHANLAAGDPPEKGRRAG